MDINVKGAIVNSSEAWIYHLFGIEATSPKMVNEAIKEANGEQLDVYINSGGGSVFAGSEIYAALRAYSGDVRIHVVGIAASAASVIACAARSDAAPTAQIMVHNVSSWAEGDYHEMDKTSDMLHQANRAIAAAYVAKSGMTEAEALQMMDKETWLTAADAVEKGLIDAIASPKNETLVASVEKLIPPEVIKKYQDMKNQLQNDLEALESKEV
jgi:ATP-dependent protease ClpP protease subunit